MPMARKQQAEFEPEFEPELSSGSVHEPERVARETIRQDAGGPARINVRRLRGEARVATRINAVLHEGRSFHPTLIVNVSRSGAGLAGPVSAMPGDLVAVQLLDGRTLPAHVRWRAGGRCGLEFLQKLEEDDQLLDGVPTRRGAGRPPSPKREQAEEAATGVSGIAAVARSEGRMVREVAMETTSRRLASSPMQEGMAGQHLGQRAMETIAMVSAALVNASCWTAAGILAFGMQPGHSLWVLATCVGATTLGGLMVLGNLREAPPLQE